jgi:sporulation protein YlmC with PRC-barrel domain
MMMEFKYGATVITSDGKKAGRLNRIVIDPETNEVTHIVVQKGLLSKEDKVIPVQEVITTSNEDVTVICTTEKFNELPPLEIEKRQDLKVTSEPGSSYQTLEGGVYPTSAPEYDVITEIKRTIPEELIATKDGAQVMSEDDEQIGKLERLHLEPESCRITELIVSHGLLNRTSKVIPIQWVQMLGEDKIRLSAGAKQVEDLPERSAV